MPDNEEWRQYDKYAVQQPCEVDKCVNEAKPCLCGNAHCAIHPHVDPVEDDDMENHPDAYEPVEESTPIVTYADGYTFVNVYEKSQGYGGPEEGGWWFNCGTIMKSVQVKVEDVDATIAALRLEFPQGPRPYYSVVYDGGDYEIVQEDHPGRDYPEHTPHYE